MSKSLDALHRLYLTSNVELPYCKDGECLDDYELVEKELERLEKIDDILNTGGGIWAENGIVSKKLKVLEIIKKLNCFTFYEIDNQYYVSGISVPKEEYELLKDNFK